MWFNDYWGNVPLDVSKLTNKKLAKLQNDIEFLNIFEHFFTLALNTFKWNNLPDTCNEKMIERGLLLSGKALFANINGGYYTLLGAPASGFNIYGLPVAARGWGYNGFNKEFTLYVPGASDSNFLLETPSGVVVDKKPKAVMGYDNANAYPYINYIIVASKRLANLMRAMDVSIQNLKQPTIITCEESMLKSVKEALNNRDDNVSAIVSAGNLPLDTFKVWNTGADPTVLIAMKEQYEWIENALKNLLGINSNSQNDKKERLLVDEVNANNDITIDNIEKRLVWRQKFAEWINDMTGLNITVEIRNKKEEESDENDIRRIDENDNTDRDI